MDADDGGAGGGDAGETIDVWCYDARAGTRGDDASENELARRAEALVSEDGARGVDGKRRADDLAGVRADGADAVR